MYICILIIILINLFIPCLEKCSQSEPRIAVANSAMISKKNLQLNMYSRYMFCLVRVHYLSAHKIVKICKLFCFVDFIGNLTSSFTYIYIQN